MAESGYELEVRDGRQHVPQGFDALLDWVRVVPTGGGNARLGEKRVVYVDDVGGNATEDVTFIVHGFVHSLNLAPLGNWNGCV